MRPLKEILPIVRTFLCTVDNPRADAFCCLASLEAMPEHISKDEHNKFQRNLFAEMYRQGLPRNGETLAELLALKDPSHEPRYANTRSPAYIAARDKWLDEWQLKLEKQS